ncbi:Pyroglutamyl-peptidase 1 [Cladobotryum mycophilum]|uniref:Pyroglutamyl-peptidase 1 n=1 Tax=Cladobotryum mycophilum TaxID=491253 RepID=A0ABR0SEZ2_9HYPO
MGSQKQDELTVLVTGFAQRRAALPGPVPRQPFLRDRKGSPGLPPTPPGQRPPLPKRRRRRRRRDHPPVRILVHPEPIHVNYETVRKLVPSFWDDPRGGPTDYDFVIHIGMAGPRPVYQIEHRGHRTGYKSKDVDGLLLEDEQEGMHGEDWIWHGLPEEITTDLDIIDVHDRWQDHSSKDMDLRISEDPGHYLCDFIYYSSLAHLYKQNRERKVIFLHVPADSSERSIAQGRDLAINLIRSIAESEVARKKK